MSMESENTQHIDVDNDDAGKRLDVFVASHAPEWISRSRIKQLIKTGHVVLNTKPCKEPNQRIKDGDVIVWTVPEPEDATPLPEDIALDVVFEDEHLIVVNKAAGMVVHPAAGNWTGTLVNALLHHCGDSLSGVGGVRRPGIVHRLDKDTTGLLVVAKSDEAHQGLAAQFADHGRTGPLVRAYQALVWNELPQPIGRVETHLGRDKNNRLKRAVVSESSIDAKIAITHYTIQRAIVVEDDRKDLAGKSRNPLHMALVECRLETGRTHQIRVHMAHLGCPLVGDGLYGAQFQTRLNRLSDTAQSVFAAFRRQALHAKTLGFQHPVTGKTHIFEAQLPEDMLNVMDSL